MNRDNFDPSEFEKIRFLGKGGTANVYLARRNSDNRLFALKTSLVDDPLALSSFRPLIEREFEFMGGQNFPGLVRVAGMRDLETSHPYLILEYCQGKTLDQIGQVDSPEILLNLFSSICISLYFIHILGISHGDLKPNNIFLTKDLPAYADGYPIYSKISDFSLAIQAQETYPARLGVGTVGYIAPETIDSNLLDSRSDIFALGIIGYILATGKHPFLDDVQGSDPVHINSAIKESQPAAPILLNNSIPKDYSELIMLMLSKSPDTRPSDTYSICRQLEQLGCRYPYQKMIRPKHLLAALKYENNEAFVRHPAINFSTDMVERVLDYSGQDNNLFRNVLEVNFTKGGVFWKDGKLTGEDSKIIWPSRMKRNIGRNFSKLTLSGRKNAIMGAVIGRPEDLPILGIRTDESGAPSQIRPLLKLLGSRISERTLRLFSNQMARQLQGNPAHVRLAARLFLRGENLDSGYETIIDCINELVGMNLYSEAFRHLQMLEHLCRQKGNAGKLKLVLMKRGDIEKMIGEAANAEKTYLSLIDSYTGCLPDRLLAETYKDLGDLYKMKQDYHSGIESLEKAKLIYEELDDKLELSHTLNNIGNIHAINNDLDRAYRTFRIALHLQKALQAAGNAASTLNNIAVIFYMRGRFARALKLFKLSLQLNVEAGIEVEIARGNNNIGYLYLESGQFSKAKGHLQESLNINRKINNKKEQLFNLNNLAQVNILLGSLKDALTYLKEGKALAKELSDVPHMADFIATTAIVQRRMGLYGSALESTKKALELVRDLADRRDASLWYIYLSEIFYDLQNHRDAALSLRQAEALIIPDDKKALLNLYLAKGIIEKCETSLDNAADLALQLNSPRDFWVAKTKKAWQNLLAGEVGKASQSLEEIIAKYNSPEPELETAKYHLALGAEKLARGMRLEARHEFETALECSVARALLPEIIESSIFLGKISAELSEFETAYEFYRKAINGYKSIADDIKDEDLRKKFLSAEKIASLASEVKRMSQVLTHKRRAGL